MEYTKCKTGIFVVGNSRSGTTMMGRILGQHADVFTFPELHFFGRLYDPKSEESLAVVLQDTYSKLKCTKEESIFSSCKGDKWSSSCPDDLKNKSFLNGQDVYEVFLCHETLSQQKSVPCEQTPRNVFFINEILNISSFDAKVICMIRDPRDVLLSQKRKWKRRFLGASKIPLSEAIRAWFNYHPVTTSMIWRSSVKNSQRFKSHPSVVHLRFEDLLSNPEECVAQVCLIIGIEFDKKMLNVPVKGSSSSKDKSSFGIDGSKVGSWKQGGLSASEIFICDYLCKQEIIEHGYEASNITPNYISLFIVLVLLPVKSLGAFFMNLHRFKNIFRVIYRKLMGK